VRDAASLRQQAHAEQHDARALQQRVQACAHNYKIQYDVACSRLRIVVERHVPAGTAKRVQKRAKDRKGSSEPMSILTLASKGEIISKLRSASSSLLTRWLHCGAKKRAHAASRIGRGQHLEDDPAPAPLAMVG